MAGDPKKAAKLLGLSVTEVNELVNILTQEKALKMMGISVDDALKAQGCKIKAAVLREQLEAVGML